MSYLKTIERLALPILGLAVVLLGVHVQRTHAESREAPWPVRLVGGERLAWNPPLESLWTATMRCTGLRPDSVDRTLELWRLDAEIPAAWFDGGQSLDRIQGLYLPDRHAVFVVSHADTAFTAMIWRHEFVHAALGARDTAHGPIFQQYGTRCGLWP